MDQEIPPAAIKENAEVNGQASEEELNEASLILNRLNGLQDEITTIGSRMDKHLRDTENLTQSTFDKLYEQTRDYKEDFLRKAMRPIFLDLIILYDMLRGIMDSYEGQPEVDVPNLINNFQALRSELLGVLERLGVEKMVNISDTFDPRMQQALQREFTDDPEKEKKVGAHLKDGFLLDGRPLRKEVVTVLRYQTTKSQEVDAKSVSEKEME